ncbi:hypothetical protein C2G38_663079 [Gigaspora rosea]|uniref:Uncharacterized protein n=1 Tax=Gigaspora rosea TaxID=44941 RepID=A0A397VPU6_9GLOM|nr:hypothetical protein C2G38_663079 [Gigaspora rosea]
MPMHFITISLFFFVNMLLSIVCCICVYICHALSLSCISIHIYIHLFFLVVFSALTLPCSCTNSIVGEAPLFLMAHRLYAKQVCTCLHFLSLLHPLQFQLMHISLPSCHAISILGNQGLLSLALLAVVVLKFLPSVLIFFSINVISANINWQFSSYAITMVNSYFMQKLLI